MHLIKRKLILLEREQYIQTDSISWTSKLYQRSNTPQLDQWWQLDLMQTASYRGNLKMFFPSCNNPPTTISSCLNERDRHALVIPTLILYVQNLHIYKKVYITHHEKQKESYPLRKRAVYSNKEHLLHLKTWPNTKHSST